MTKRIIAVLLTICIAVSGFTLVSSAKETDSLEEKLSLLYEEITNDSEISNAVRNISRPVVFISLSDGKKQAKVVYARGSNLKKAFDKAAEKAYNLNMTAYWVKCDVVTDIEAVTYTDLCERLKSSNPCCFRKGIAFNNYFGRALLEAELNSNDFMDFEKGGLKLDNINSYFSDNRKIKLDKIPETLYLFETKAYFCDEQSKTYELNEYYRRYTDMDEQALKQLCADTSDYFGSILKEDGSFYYGDQVIPLSKNEYRILVVLMKQKGKVVSREKLMETLWQTDEFVDENALTVNVGRLRKKLEKAGLEQFIETKFGMGYVIPEA